VEEKIICSLEDWDSILNYYRPNGSSKTWYIKELKRLAIPHMWGQWNVYTEQGEMFQDGHMRNSITPTHSSLIKYTPKEEIGDSKHIYIINVYSHDFFTLNNEIGLKCISPEYIEDIRNGKCKILMFFIYEGYSGIQNNYDFEMIEKWRLQMNFPVNSIYYVCGNLLSEQIVKNKGLGYQARGIHYFEPWNQYKGPMVDFKPSDDKYLFLSYNRQPRHHRLRFMIDLYEKGLIYDGLISLDKIVHPLPYPVPPEVHHFFYNNTPFMIDSMPELRFNLACNITTEDFERTFVSVVTETLVDTGTLFFSEKIWKPIMVGHPFLLYGNEGSLKYLKSIGYKTFDRWWDESYDSEPDRDKRSKMIVDELLKLKQKTKEELIKIREEIQEVLIHNKENYNRIYKEKYSESDQSSTIREVLLEIWNELNG
jgi:hypothetical protein